MAPTVKSKDQTPPKPWQSVLAGASAGGVESLVTYPTEYVKTRQQLMATSTSKAASPVRILVDTLRQQGPGALYSGGAAFCISNASKSGVRFLAFDHVRRYVPRDPTTGKATPLGNMYAGMGAGVAESVLVLTPGETIKTKMIEEQGSRRTSAKTLAAGNNAAAAATGGVASGPASARQYSSASRTIVTILKTEGIRGFYAGVVPVTLKQSANAMVRFTSYNFLLETLQAARLRLLPAAATPAVAGALAGCITVYATMPFDNLKTRLQSNQGHALYGGSSLRCMRVVLQTEGVRALWKGTTPRLVRLCTASG
ncbi:Mitochondrial carrier domain protein [Niveomyces insectorum RCEF 264]|uniref:Mitochondrial carrier domain protein n=1 Tax=Niveomyces insectorum RCEF 264 TaxID=1081102 RepID=A0A167T7S2_9HYPO|nr:Mitochondrial carrier domain protein [Niveomyces insectorum RCEF 264]